MYLISLKGLNSLMKLYFIYTILNFSDEKNEAEGRKSNPDSYSLSVLGC